MNANPGDGGGPKFGKMVPGGTGGSPPVAPSPSYGVPPGSEVPPPSAVPPPLGHVATPPAATPFPGTPVPAAAPVPAVVPPGPAVPAAAPAGAAATDPILFSIGDIAVSRSWVVTPNGTAPIGGSTWIGQDMTRTETKTPTWAIVLAIVGFLFCLLGLLFLIAKEERTTGYFEVTVQSGSVRHVTQIPISNPAQIAHYRQMVHQAQALAAAA